MAETYGARAYTTGFDTNGGMDVAGTGTEAAGPQLIGLFPGSPRGRMPVTASLISGVLWQE